MIRQYIGSRYVPKFYENVNGTSDWAEGISYEPLTIVTYAGNSFTSKKTVPSNVGAPNENNEYWASTGNYNEQVELYRQIVENLKSDYEPFKSNTEKRLDEIENEISKEIIIIGDSYGVDSSAGGKSWATYIENSYNCYRNTVGGTGFGSDVYINENFLSQLKSINVTDANKIKQIVVLGGGNDGNLLSDGRLTESSLKAKIDEFITYCAKTFKYATVKIAFVAWYRNNSKFDSYIKCASFYNDECTKFKNAVYNGDGETIMHNNAFINDTDLIHPTAYASGKLAQFCSSLIENQSFRFVNVSDARINNIPNGKWTVSNVAKLPSHFSHNVHSITFIGTNNNNSYIAFNYGNNENITLRAGDATELAVITGTPVGGTDPCGGSISAVIGEYGGNVTRNIPFFVAIQNNKLVIKNVSGIDYKIHTFLLPLCTIISDLAKN